MFQTRYSVIYAAVILLLVSFISCFAYHIQLDYSDLQVFDSKLPNQPDAKYYMIKGGTGLPVEPGAPALPGYSIRLALPPGMEIDNVEVNYAEPEALPGYIKIAAQQKMQKMGDATEPVAPDESIYSSNLQFPGKLAYAWHSGCASGYQTGTILFAPLQYLPQTGQLLFYHDISFSITYKASNVDITYPRVRLDWMEEQLHEDMEKQVINPEEVVSPPTELVSGENDTKTEVYPYLIISQFAENTEDIAKLKTWKTRKGLNAKFMLISDILITYSGVDDLEKIRNCIKDYYLNYGTVYVCMIGGQPSTPPSGVGAYPPMRVIYPSGPLGAFATTECYYYCLDGTWNADGDAYFGEYYPDNNDRKDYSADVFLGRLQSSASGDIARLIDKTLCYQGASSASENNPWDYQGGALLAGAWLSTTTNQELEMECIRDSYLNPNPFWQSTILGDTSPFSSTFNHDSFINALNNAPGITAHAMHSGWRYLGTNPLELGATQEYSSISNSDLHALNNAPRYAGIFYSLGCHTADPYYNENCAESYTTAPNGGGVGYIGNTEIGSYTPGAPLVASAGTQIEFFRQLTELGQPVTSKALVNAKIAGVVPPYLPSSDWTFLYLMGDPENDIYTGYIGTFSVTYLYPVPLGTQDYTIIVSNSYGHAVADALVCIWKGDEVNRSGLTQSNGTIVFRNINITTMGQMLITVTKHNYRPYEQSINTGGPLVKLRSFIQKPGKNGIRLSWTTSSNIAIDGFNLYRQDNVDYSQKTSNSALSSSLADEGKLKATNKQRDKASSLHETGKWYKVNTSLITGKKVYIYLDKSAESLSPQYYLEAVVGGVAYKLTDLPTLSLGDENNNKPAFAVIAAPNPAHQNLSITISLSQAGLVSVEIYDLSGRLVKRENHNIVNSGTFVVDLDTSALCSGVYSLVATSGDEFINQRIVVAH